MTITGRSGFRYVQLPSALVQGADGSWTTELRFRGTFDALGAIENQVPGQKSYEHEEGPWYLLRSRVAGRIEDGFQQRNPDSEVVTLWSLQPARLEKDIFTHPRIAAELRKVTDAGERARFKARLQKLSAGDAVDYDPPATDSGSAAQRTLLTENVLAEAAALRMNRTEVLAFIGSLGFGTEAYPIPNVVLRKTQIAPPDATAGPSVADWNRVWTTQTLLSRERRTMPDVIIAAIQAVVTSTRTAASPGYWLKEFPGYDQRDGTRVEITTQWTFADDFDRYVFGNPV